jgi:hypothetical protein
MIYLIDNMEQIVKIFVQHSYFIENDLIVDYNVEQGVIITLHHFYIIYNNKYYF